MRDKIAEIIRNARMNANPLTQVGYAEADALIANGFILPPCKVGDTVYYVHETLWDKDYKNKVLSKSVKKRILKIVERPNCSTNLALEVLHFDYCFITDWIEGNIFLTKEEAEKALKEKENE